MSRPIWSGSLSFGLVRVPVKLHGAVAPKRVQLHLLHDEDGARIQQKRVCSADGQEVPYEHVVKGYEIRRGRYVEVTRGELEALDPRSSHVIELEDFVGVGEIDPIFFDTTYHVMPGDGALRPFMAVATALRVSGRMGLGRLVMYQKGHLCAVRPYGRGLVITTLHFADELVLQDSFPELAVPGPRPSEQEVDSVLRLIESRATPFEPQRYHDVHRERLLAFLEKRARARGLRPAVEAPRAEAEARPALAEEAAGGEVAPLPTGGALRMRREAARAVRQRPDRQESARGTTVPRPRRKREEPEATKAQEGEPEATRAQEGEPEVP